MSRIFPHLMILAATLGLAASAAETPAAKARPLTAADAAAKKITDRYKQTHEHIETLIGSRQHPEALPANLPNPFYHAPVVTEEAAVETKAEAAPVPAAADISDIDTLIKYATGLRISGLVTLNDTSYLTINQTLCKVGDVVPIGTKEHPVYLSVLAITPQELTLGLNAATYSVRLKH